MWLQSHNGAPTIVLRMDEVMEASGTLLGSISDYCRRTGLAESTFGRRAVNDGKLTARLRNGGRITTDTLDRIHGFMAAHPAHGDRPAIIERARDGRAGSPPSPPAPSRAGDP